MADDDEIRHLRRALATAEQRAEKAQERAEEAQGRAETAERLSNRTTFPDFLELCHERFTAQLRIETDRSLTTKGSITNPTQRKHPTYLRPWLEFPRTHLHYFDAAYELLCNDGDPPSFTPRIALEEEGHTVCRQALTSERDLEYYDRTAVAEKVRQVLEQLTSMTAAQKLVNHCTGVEFSNHLNALAEESVSEGKRPRLSPVDQGCVYRRVDGKRSLLLIREYKPAHKLTSPYLRAGLRPMTIRDEVVQRATIPIEASEKLKYNADRVVAAAVTQTYEYMIDNGLEYGSIATGAAEVFLQVREDEPETVYYYLTEFKLDIANSEEWGFPYPFTAVARLLGFSLMAMHTDIRTHEWRYAAKEKLHPWTADFEAILRQIPAEERRDSPEGSLYSSPEYPIDPRSPYLTRRRRQLATADKQPYIASFGSDSSSEGPDKWQSATPSRSGAAKRKRTSTGVAPKPVENKITSQEHRTKAYCTMKCLSGLKQQQRFDPSCPHYAEHRQASICEVHSLDIVTFRQQVRSQLGSDLDHHCTPLDIQGSTGALFKITLTSHGYTFVAKGTVERSRPKLLYEGNIYEHRLFPVQSSATPIYLGNVDLVRPYLYDVKVKICHMLMLSWGGKSLHQSVPPIPPSILEQQKKLSLQAISQLGIIHGDPRSSNMLWNPEKQRVLIIDFELSHIQNPRKRRDNSTPSLPRKNIKRPRIQHSDAPGETSVMPTPSPPGHAIHSIAV